MRNRVFIFIVLAAAAGAACDRECNLDDLRCGTDEVCVWQDATSGVCRARCDDGCPPLQFCTGTTSSCPVCMDVIGYCQ
ncbi:MAG: hypothetical protein A2138_27260 [Deltaproteobacteria bacterium RBG_16_71_12]|nr:MAG: hypothetical protein A2138_27260 [Deltaproteobacteria bacterium RBG_16_71_12]